MRMVGSLAVESCSSLGLVVENLAAVVFLSFVVSQIRFVILILQAKLHVLIWDNNLWFDELVCMMNWVCFAGNFRS